MMPGQKFDFIVTKHFQDDSLIIQMEYCSGGSLRDRLDKGKMCASEVFRILQEVLCGLEYIHSIDLIHRDIKPVSANEH